MRVDQVLSSTQYPQKKESNKQKKKKGGLGKSFSQVLLDEFKRRDDSNVVR
jgi:hypothetical protein